MPIDHTQWNATRAHKTNQQPNPRDGCHTCQPHPLEPMPRSASLVLLPDPALISHQPDKANWLANRRSVRVRAARHYWQHQPKWQRMRVTGPKAISRPLSIVQPICPCLASLVFLLGGNTGQAWKAGMRTVGPWSYRRRQRAHARLDQRPDPRDEKRPTRTLTSRCRGLPGHITRTTAGLGAARHTQHPLSPPCS